MKRTNEMYEITVGTPLLRPGLTLRVIGVSDRYAEQTMEKVMQIVKAFNRTQIESNPDTIAESELG